MNNCDLEKLSLPGVTLEPPFNPDVTRYKATLPSQRTEITVDAYPSDSGASSTLLGNGGSRVVKLKDGLNSVVVEVTAEDGTVKKYVLEITKLSASQTLLQGISLSEDLTLTPAFSSSVFEYSCSTPYFQNSINMQPLIQDKEMKVTVNGSSEMKPMPITVGDTPIEVLVNSPDGTQSQVYRIIVTREQLPFCVTFLDTQDQAKYECPISLTALYRPVSIRGSDPQHTISGPYMDFLTRRSKRDPLDETILAEDWRVPDYELDIKMSAAIVRCCFAYRGCKDAVKLADLGSHIKNCPFKPSTELDPQIVTETEWYKDALGKAESPESRFQHTVQERNWEKRLQQVHEKNIDRLCRHAEENIHLYKQRLPKPGDVLAYKEGMSPLDALSQAAAAYASAIKLQPKNPKLHYHLATVLEEFYYAGEVYGLKKNTECEAADISHAKAAGREEEILAICSLHGVTGRPSLEQQLKALDLEYHQLKEQGQSGKADYIQGLYAWKAKRAGQSLSISMDEENPFTQSFLKYKDALALDPNNWLYGLHVGRHMLRQRQMEEALIILQNALAHGPASAITRCYVGLALMEQDGGPGSRTQEAVVYLQQGLEKLIMDLVTQERSPVLLADNPLCIFNAELLSGFVKFGKLLKNFSNRSAFALMTSQQVLHLLADWSAKALCRCPHRGVVTQDLEWTLLEACFGLLELLVDESSANGPWIRRRCQALSALIRLSSIPHCTRLLDMQEKVCQLGVISSPCDSSILYSLGAAQLARYDDRPETEEGKQALQDAKLSFQASISLENMPTNGQPLAQLTSQKWWKASEDMKKQKLLKQVNAEKPNTATSQPQRGAPKGRGTAPLSRGAGTASKPVPLVRTGGASTRGGSNAKPTTQPKGSNPKREVSRGGSTMPGPTSVSRGRGGAVSSKPATASPSKPLVQASAAPAIKVPEQAALPENSPPPLKEERVPGLLPVNRSSFLPRLGFARALSRSKEDRADASQLYHEVIKMAPEVHDAYIELAELLAEGDPLGAVDVYCQYPHKPVEEQTFEDAFIPGEVVRLLMKCEKYDDPRLPANMIIYGKIMGIGSLEKYIHVLEEKFKTGILKKVYSGIHNKSEDDEELQNFFRFKCWL